MGNGISTFPDYPADIRAPQGSLTGVSGFQVHIGAGRVYTPGDSCDVLVAMNAAALKTQYKYAKPQATIIIDTDSFGPNDLKKGAVRIGRLSRGDGHQPRQGDCLSDNEDGEGLSGRVRNGQQGCTEMPQYVRAGHRVLAVQPRGEPGGNFLREKFAKKPQIAENNIKVVRAGYDYGHNVHASVPATYRIETKHAAPGRYMDITGNKATVYGLIAAAEKAGLKLYLGSYPITPATDILHELSKHKSCGAITVQCEDEISACASAVGAAFAGALAVTSTSGPGICLKSETINLAVIDELPLVIIDVQRGGSSTGLPTKSEQTDLLQVLYGRNGESPMPVIAATSPTNCFDAAYMACKIALEHLTPVVLLTDAFIANGSAAWKLPTMDDLPEIHPHYARRNRNTSIRPIIATPETNVRYWAVPGQEGYTHILGGLEKDGETGAISTEPENHDRMNRLRYDKVQLIPVPDLEVQGDKDNAELLIVGFGSTYGHLYSAMEELRAKGYKVALAQFSCINPLPKNTVEVLTRYKKGGSGGADLGQFAALLRIRLNNFAPYQYNQVKGQPFVVADLVKGFEKVINSDESPKGQTFKSKIIK